jgi:peptidyl-prolyl cis-trans isomerase C
VSPVLHTRLRKTTLVLSALLIGGALSGCSTVTKGDVVASVDDVELDRDQFAELVDGRRAAQGVPVDSLPTPEAARVDGQTAREIAGQFVTLELVRNDLAVLGIEAPPIDDQLSPIERFDTEYQTLGQTWVGAPPEALADEQLRAFYEQGPKATGVVCAQHILVAEEAEALAVIERIEAGEAFESVAAETSLDTQSGAVGGALGCNPIDAFRETFVPEFVDGTLAIGAGATSEPVQSEFGYHVIRTVPFDSLAGNDLLLTRLVALGEWYEVTTDPEVGTWSVINVVPLG